MSMNNRNASEGSERPITHNASEGSERKSRRQ